MIQYLHTGVLTIVELLTLLYIIDRSGGERHRYNSEPAYRRTNIQTNIHLTNIQPCTKNDILFKNLSRSEHISETNDNMDNNLLKTDDTISFDGFPVLDHDIETESDKLTTNEPDKITDILPNKRTDMCMDGRPWSGVTDRFSAELSQSNDTVFCIRSRSQETKTLRRSTNMQWKNQIYEFKVCFKFHMFVFCSNLVL